MTTVDQQKIRRTRTGLIAHDPARAQPGYTLFAPMFGDGTVYLVDMAGAVAHTWRMPYRPGLYGYLLENGHLFYGGKVAQDLDALRGVAALQGRGRAGGGLARAGRLGGPAPRSPSRRAAAPERQRAPPLPARRCPRSSPRASAAACRAPRPTARSTPTISSR